MISIYSFKNTVLFFMLFGISCRNLDKNKIPDLETENTASIINIIENKNETPAILVGANNTTAYLSLLKDKRVGIVANHTSLISKTNTSNNVLYINLIDSLLNLKIAVKKIYSPEHGFRGLADAGELIKDGKDFNTGLPIISLYGNNKKPKAKQLEGIDILVFDLQDVGSRFFTYISTLHYVMEACAENHIPIIILDRPNPNGGIIDGPVLEKIHSSFVGMHPIPILHGMTIGEYGKMINGEKWLKNGIQCELTIIPCLNYNRDIPYHLPINPSPNLPNDQAINLYASLCLFEGTNVSVGRGTDYQFQIYGSPYLPKSDFYFTPKPKFGASHPLHNGQECYGKDLSTEKRLTQLELKWLIDAYQTTANQSKFFIPFFTNLAGTKKLQKQIESEISEIDIRKSWESDLTAFKKRSIPYLIYKN